VIEKQRAENTKLRREKFDLQAKVNVARIREEEKQEETRNHFNSRPTPSHHNHHSNQNAAELQEMHALQMAFELQEQEQRNRKIQINLVIEEREMMMNAMMASAFHPTNDFQSEEERLIQRAIEESKQDGNDPDSMTYEQLLELGERLGKVQCGLSPTQIAKLPTRTFRLGFGAKETPSCSVCFEEFESGQKVRTLPLCSH